MVGKSLADDSIIMSSRVKMSQTTEGRSNDDKYRDVLVHEDAAISEN